MKQGYLVLGAEGSGNRLMTRLLIAGGCSGNAESPYSDVEPENDVPFVWFRSVPYAQQVPNLYTLIDSLQDVHWRVVVMLRDWYPQQHSQVAIGHCSPLPCEERTRAALSYIFEFVSRRQLEYYPVTYSGLVNHPYELVPWLVSVLELPRFPAEIMYEIKDADTKWWQIGSSAVSVWQAKT